MFDVDFDARYFESTLKDLIDSLRGRNLDLNSDDMISLYRNLFERMG